MPPPTPIAAAGRVISGANANRLLDAHQSLAAGLRSLGSVLTDTGYLESESKGYPSPPFAVEAIALTLRQWVEVQAWHHRVGAIINALYSLMLHSGSDSSDFADGMDMLRESLSQVPTQSPVYVNEYFWLNDEADESEDDLPIDGAIAYRTRYFTLKVAFEEYVGRLNHILNNQPDFADAIAGLTDQFEAFLQGQIAEPIAAKSDTPDTAAAESDTPDNAIAAKSEPDPEPAPPEAVPEPDIEIAAASGELEAEWDLAIAASASVADDDDAIAIEGVLFRVDEPSECVPEQGPGLPLFIASDVAAAALGRVMGRPLDAHESLAAHGGGVVGAIVSGEVRDRDGIVHGFLHNYHVPDRVSDIRAAAISGNLGMSMLGKIAWHRGTVDGREVAIVDRLVLRGGTILQANTATYRKTKVRLVSARDRHGNVLPLAAIAQPDAPPPTGSPDPPEPIAQPEPEIAIAASEVSPTPDETMTTESNPTQDVTAAAIIELQDKLLGAITALGDRLSTVEAAQAAQAQAEADRAEAERKAAEEEAQIAAMASKVMDAIAPSLDEKIAAAIAPRPGAQPARRITTAPLLRTPTTPVAAAEDPVAVLTQQLKATPLSDRSTRIAIKDQIAGLLRNA